MTDSDYFICINHHIKMSQYWFWLKAVSTWPDSHGNSWIHFLAWQMLSVHHTRPKKPFWARQGVLLSGEQGLSSSSGLICCSFILTSIIIYQETLSNRTLVYFGHHPGRFLLPQWFPLGLHETPQVPSADGLEMAWSLMKQCSITLDIAQLARQLALWSMSQFPQSERFSLQ